MVDGSALMRENDGISRTKCARQKRGGIPPSQNCEILGKTALRYGFDPLKSCGFLLKRNGFMLKNSETMLKITETNH